MRPLSCFAGSVALLLAAPAFAEHHPMTGGEIGRAIERLAVVGNVLYVAAHPDDENTLLLTWLVRERGVRATYLSLTRGEGGQNLVGAEQAPLLGLIRTHELLAARDIDGAHQIFGRQRDFGYSKTPDETLAIWGKDATLADVVWAIRRVRPDVIITRFSPEARDTHGHHSASAMIALEAFTRAADPKSFPEQLQWTQPWQAKRIVWNKGVFGGAPKPEDLLFFLKLDVQGFDPVLGVSYGELSAQSRSMHKSQGFGVAAQRGPAIEYFKVLAGEPMKESLFDGIDLGWSRVHGAEKLAAIIAKARREYDATKPAASIPSLLAARDALLGLPADPWRDDRVADIEELVGACAGLYLDATAASAVVTPGGEVVVTTTAQNRSSAPTTMTGLRIVAGDTTLAHEHGDQALSQPVNGTRTVKLPTATPASAPYWLRAAPEPGRWTVADQRDVGVAEDPPVLSARFELVVHGEPLTLARPVTFAWTDPVLGERRKPLAVVPVVTVAPATPLVVFPDAHKKTLRLVLRGTGTGTLTVNAPAGYRVEPAAQRFTLSGADTELSFVVQPPKEERPSPESLTFTLDPGGEAASVATVDYPHIPRQTVVQPAVVKLLRADVARTGKRVGYVPGAGDEMPAALRELGYEVVLLDDAALGERKLDDLDAIVLGVRAFNTNPRLAAEQKRLLDYVEAGGTVVAQYNTNNRLSKLEAAIGPWPFTITQDRVTEEDAAVTLALPKHAVLNQPNRIETRDFAGWVQERGLYFAGTFDERYAAPLAMHDAGEPERKGSLLVARFGKGRFVYTGLALFRQLPAGVPGAYRLLANLLAHEP